MDIINILYIYINELNEIGGVKETSLISEVEYLIKTINEYEQQMQK